MYRILLYRVEYWVIGFFILTLVYISCLEVVYVLDWNENYFKIKHGMDHMVLWNLWNEVNTP